jgi:hypothetical protein
LPHNLSVEFGKRQTDAMGQQFPLLNCRLIPQVGKEFTELV